MNIGKEKYDNIPISEKLDQVIWDNMRREEKEHQTKKIYKWLLGTAAVLGVMFCGANVTPIYSYASQLPVLGAVVQVFHVGSGGERTDGAYTQSSKQGETVEIHFERHSEKLNTAPVYSVTHLLAPNRVCLTLHGVRGIDYETISDNLLATRAVKDVYRTMIGDDSMCGFTMILNSGYTYEVTEYADPAYLSIRFYEDEDAQPDRRIYYLRSQSMQYGEELGLLNELYASEGATQLKTKNGKYIITIGQFESLSDAEEAMEALNEKYGTDTGFTVGYGSVDEIPEADLLEKDSETVDETKENLEQCLALMGKDDASAASLLGGGKESIAADGTTLIGRTYKVRLFEEETEVGTLYDAYGHVSVITVELKKKDASDYSKKLKELYGNPIEVNDTSSEGGATWETWKIEENQLRLYQEKGLSTLEINIII